VVNGTHPPREGGQPSPSTEPLQCPFAPNRKIQAWARSAP
jgi:hypothetical protein